VFVSGRLLVACGADSNKDGPNGNGNKGDGGITADTGDLCGFCLDNAYTPCDGPGKPGTPITCPIDQVCVPQKGCLPCSPGVDTCVGNEVHHCSDTGMVGDKVKDCDPGKGERCDKGVCRNACDVVAESPSNVGCEFWAVDLDNAKNIIDDAANKPWGLVFSNAAEGSVTVTLEQNDAPPGMPLKLTTVKTLTIKKDELGTAILPPREVDGSTKGMNEGPGTFLSSNAIRVTSTGPIIVYQFNAFEPTFSNDASLLLPRNGLGKIHRVLNYPTSKPIYPGFGPDLRDHAYVTVVGTAASTNVKVTLGTNIVAGGPITTAKKKGEVIELTLNPFDVLNLESDGLPGDMTGTIVESSNPVLVFSGTEGSVAPVGLMGIPEPPGHMADDTCCVDHLEEQVFPVTAMGKKFVVTRSPIRSTTSYVEPDVLRFLGIAEEATVKTNLPPPWDNFTIKPGEMKETWTTTDIVVESSAPLAVGQILVSQAHVDGRLIGDPSLTIFPAAEQFRSNYLFLVPPKWSENYVVVAAPMGTEIKIDGAVPTDCKVAPAGMLDGVAYEARRCPVKEGVRRVTGDKPFGVTAYGYGPAGSYAFVGGADVKPIYTPPPLK
jgi:hypothetical protein